MTGTGGTGLAALPIRLDTLRHAGVVALAAAKFHSAAVTAEGRLLTWGWGRGGRLGERWEALADECMHVLAMTCCACPCHAFNHACNSGLQLLFDCCHWHLAAYRPQ